MLCLRHYPTPTSRCSYSTKTIVYIPTLVVEEYPYKIPKTHTHIYIYIYQRNFRLKISELWTNVQGHSCDNRKVSKSSSSAGVAEGNRIRERVNSRVKTFFGCEPCVSGVAEVGFLFLRLTLEKF